MSISDTANAKRYASIAEASAAQCALYTEEARNSPQYASDARQSAEAAQAAQAQSATNAQQALQAASSASQNSAIATQASATAVTAGSSASASASSAAASASQAQTAASEVTAELSKTVRATDISLSALPDAATRAGKLISFNDTGDVIASVPASGSATEVYEELAKSTGASLVGYGAGTLADVGDKVATQISGGLTFTGGGTLTSIRDFIFYPANNTWYYWTGTFNKTVVAGSNPLSDSGWKAAGDAQLRSELASATGYTLLPSLQIQQWKSVGDIRGWGAVCDGVTDDIAAITQAISDTGGKILVPGNIFVSTHILFLNKTNPVITFANQATVTINTSFTFADAYRGIIVFDGCSNPSAVDPFITGAKLDKSNGGTDAVADGDSGVEYLHCTGLCHTVNPNVRDVKAWGVIHVEVEDYHVENPVMENCQVQSGVGAQTFRSGIITNPIMRFIGLYGAEFETINENQKAVVIGGIISGTQKGVGVVNNSKNIHVSGTTILECFVGLSCSVSPEGSAYNPANFTTNGTATISCKTSIEIVGANDVSIDANVSERDSIDFYTRVSAYDRFYRFSSGVGYIPIYDGAPAPVVGLKIRLDNGVEYTISSISPNITDPVFGQLTGFTCSPALTDDCLRRAFSRYVEITSLQTGIAMRGGQRNEIKNSIFKDSTTLIASYGDHLRFKFGNNTLQGIANLFDTGSSGTVTGRVNIDTKDCDNVGWGPGFNKFAPSFCATRVYTFSGGSTPEETRKSNAVFIDDSLISGISCAINSGQTTTGKIVLRVNGNDTITQDNLSGTPLRGSLTLPSALGAGGAAIIQLTDTVGDLITTGYSVQLTGAFRK